MPLHINFIRVSIKLSIINYTQVTRILVSETCRRLKLNIIMITMHPVRVIMKSIHPITNPASRPDGDEVHIVYITACAYRC